MTEEPKQVLDLAAASTGIMALVTWLPPIAAVFTIVWYGIVYGKRHCSRFAKNANLMVLSSSFTVANQQEGSLNTYNGDGSTTNSNNTTEDNSVSNSYSGAGASSQIPVGSAISPSYMSNGVETCLQGVGSSVQTVLWDGLAVSIKAILTAIAEGMQ